MAYIDVDGLLGSDFLCKYKCKIDLGRRALSFDIDPKPPMQMSDSDIVEDEPDEPPSKCYVVLDETVVIAEGQEMLVAARIVDPQVLPQSGCDGHLVPSPKFVGKYGVLVTDSLIQPSCDRVPLRVLNIKKKEVTLYSGSVAATCEPVVEVRAVEVAATTEVHPGENDSDGGEDRVPDHLEDLYSRCVKELEPNQAVKLAECLRQNADVFATSPEDREDYPFSKEKKSEPWCERC